jgi:serine/threonine-protein kinase 24/25/MST4
MTPPEIDPKKWSKEMREFVKICLTKDPKERPSAEELLQHPFMRDSQARKQGKIELIHLIKQYQESCN